MDTQKKTFHCKTTTEQELTGKKNPAKTAEINYIWTFLIWTGHLQVWNTKQTAALIQLGQTGS